MHYNEKSLYNKMSYSQNIFGQNSQSEVTRLPFSLKNETVYVVLEIVKSNQFGSFNSEQICTVIGVYEDKYQADLVRNQYPAIRKICSSTLTKSFRDNIFTHSTPNYQDPLLSTSNPVVKLYPSNNLFGNNVNNVNNVYNGFDVVKNSDAMDLS